MDIRFERDSLFQEVWSTPLTTLAKKYGMSDNGIRKVCKALNIPLPTAGHWAKVAAGRVIPPPTLPATTGPTEFHSSPPPRPPTSLELSEDEQWLNDRIKFEECPSHRITVDLHPERWHRLVVQTRKRLSELAKEMERARLVAQKPLKQTRLPRPDIGGISWKWKYFIERGQVLELYKAHLPLRVSPGTYERALAITNTLLFSAEDRGFQVVHNKNGRLLLESRECKVQVRLSEKLGDARRDKLSDTSRNPDSRTDNVKVPTGILRIYFSASYSEAELQETTDHRLEQRLNDFFKRVYGAIVRERIRQREREERQRAYEEEVERNRKAEAIRQKEVQQRAQENERRRNLLAEAQSWRDADLIRKYIAHIERTFGPIDSDVDPELAGWLVWAEQVVQEMDPSTRWINTDDGSGC